LVSCQYHCYTKWYNGLTRVSSEVSLEADDRLKPAHRKATSITPPLPLAPGELVQGHEAAADQGMTP
jgi:hypothetical protein